MGRRGGLRSVLSQVEVLAPTNATVLITGETGTGKEVIARAVHELSPRRTKNLVKFNCAAVPAGLLESELFGHERGAFTGAINSHVGCFALADPGTLFLDEIGDMPLELQPKLLRVLQEREFEALGSTRTTRVDVRVVAATNQDLKQMARDREFREDLPWFATAGPVTFESYKTTSRGASSFPMMARALEAIADRIEGRPSQVGDFEESLALLQRAVSTYEGSERSSPCSAESKA